MTLLDKLIPSYARIPLLILGIVNCSVYWGTRIIASDWKHYDMSLPIDSQFPFLPWTIVIYFGCYIFWVTNIVLGSRFGKTQAYRFIFAEVMSKIICMFFFLLLPTTMNRPEIDPKNIFDYAMIMLYKSDAADNLFPSIHCSISWFCFLGVKKNPKIPFAYKVFSLIFALMVCISTLTTKQHVLVDTFMGVGLAEVCYFITGCYFRKHPFPGETKEDVF